MVNAVPGRQAPDLIRLVLAAPSIESVCDLLTSDPRSSLGTGGPSSSSSTLQSSELIVKDFQEIIDSFINVIRSFMSC